MLAFLLNLETGEMEPVGPEAFVRLEIFTFNPSDGSPEIELNATFLREHLVSSGEEPGRVIIHPQMVQACANNHEPEKLARLSTAPGDVLAEPIIILEWPSDPPEHVVADGNHRVILIYELFKQFRPGKNPQCLAWIVKKPVWEKFLLGSAL